jgi:hypothetical protein
MEVSQSVSDIPNARSLCNDAVFGLKGYSSIGDGATSPRLSHQSFPHLHYFVSLPFHHPDNQVFKNKRCEGGKALMKQVQSMHSVKFLGNSNFCCRQSRLV